MEHVAISVSHEGSNSKQLLAEKYLSTSELLKALSLLFKEKLQSPV